LASSRRLSRATRRVQRCTSLRRRDRLAGTVFVLTLEIIACISSLLQYTLYCLLCHISDWHCVICVWPRYQHPLKQQAQKGTPSFCG
jgi:hypothetical protein